MIRVVVFDLDGTLLKQGIDFPRLRREIGAPHGMDIIEFMRSLDPDRREEVENTIVRHEEKAASDSELNDGAEDVLAFLASRNIPRAVFTRNSRRSLASAVERHGLDLAVVCCRGDTRPKPSPEPLQRIADDLGVPPASILAVGDYSYDTESAIHAGAISVFLTNGEEPPTGTRAHFVIEKLGELIHLVSGLRDGSILPGPPRPLETGRC